MHIFIYPMHDAVSHRMLLRWAIAGILCLLCHPDQRDEVKRLLVFSFSFGGGHQQGQRMRCRSSINQIEKEIKRNISSWSCFGLTRKPQVARETNTCTRGNFEIIPPPPPPPSSRTMVAKRFRNTARTQGSVASNERDAETSPIIASEYKGF